MEKKLIGMIIYGLILLGLSIWTFFFPKTINQMGKHDDEPKIFNFKFHINSPVNIYIARFIGIVCFVIFCLDVYFIITGKWRNLF